MKRGLLALAMSLLLLLPVAAHASAPAPGTGADAYRAVVDYTNLGLHRTGTAGDTATASWLAAQFSAAGLHTSVENFTFPQFRPKTARVTVGSYSPTTFPLYYYGRTPPGGVSAPLVDIGLGTPADIAAHPPAGKIALVEVPMPLPGAGPTLGRALTAASQAGARAVIAATDAPKNAISVFDVDARGGFCNLPTLLVGKHDGQQLRKLSGRAATVVLDADEDSAGSADNVLGVIPGKTNNVVVIGTPITGWFSASVERGAGIGVLVTLARALAKTYATTPPPQTILFVGTSGHEVGFLGLEKLLAAHPELKPRVTAYLHLGAGVAARHYVVVGDQVIATNVAEPARLLSFSENPLLAPLALRAAVTNKVVPFVPVPEGVGAAGEEVFMSLAGAPVVALKSVHQWIHTAQDRPDGTSAALLDPVVHMYRDLVGKLLVQSPAQLRQANAVANAIAPHTADTLKGVGVIRCTP